MGWWSGSPGAVGIVGGSPHRGGVWERRATPGVAGGCWSVGMSGGIKASAPEKNPKSREGGGQGSRAGVTNDRLALPCVGMLRAGLAAAGGLFCCRLRLPSQHVARFRHVPRLCRSSAAGALATTHAQGPAVAPPAPRVPRRPPPALPATPTH